jgi:hypothetical protein
VNESGPALLSAAGEAWRLRRLEIDIYQQLV